MSDKTDTKKLLNDCLEAMAIDITRIKQKSQEESLDLSEGRLLTDYVKVLASLSKLRDEEEINAISELSTEEITKLAKEVLEKSEKKAEDD